jgi:predicted PurR-regulated permease PerM
MSDGLGESAVPRPLRLAAAYSWRLLLVAAAGVLLALTLVELRLVVLAVVLALFATALLRPPAQWLRRRGWPDGAAALAALAGALLVLAGVLVTILPPFVDQLDELGGTLREGIEDVGDELLGGPGNATERGLDDYLDSAAAQLEENAEAVAGGLFSGALLLLEVVVGLALALVLTFFFLKDGERIWAWVVGVSPARARADLTEIGQRSWRTLGGYLRGVTLVALFDAAFIGLALVVLGVPAALPLAVLTFLGAYIPIAGAVLTGVAAVLVALVADGLVTAGLVAAAVIVVQQIESNLLHPVVVGRAVALHPVATLLALTTGGVVAGVVGAILAVPLAAVAAQAGGYLREGPERPETAGAVPEADQESALSR